MVSTITGTDVEWRYLSVREGNVWINSLGTAAAVGTGMALAMPHRRVIVLDGDGSALMDLGCLTVLGTHQPANLKIFVFDNQVYSGTRISHPSGTAFGANLELMARGAGIDQAKTLTDLESFKTEAMAAVSEPGVAYVVVKVQEDRGAQRLSLKARHMRRFVDRMENRYRFLRYVEETEGLLD